MLHYNSDGWEPLFVEMGFSKIIYEDEDFVFVYEVRLIWLLKLLVVMCQGYRRPQVYIS
jgi:hypothetical protein